MWRPHESNFGNKKDILAVTMDAKGTTVSGTYCWPQGFWVDLNNVEGAPLVVNRDSPDYKFDQIVKNFYAETVWYLE